MKLRLRYSNIVQIINNGRYLMESNCPYCGKDMGEPQDFDAELYVACEPCKRVFKYPLKKMEDKKE